MVTRDEIDKLKKDWEEDGCFDLPYDDPDYAEFREELYVFYLEKSLDSAKMQIERQRAELSRFDHFISVIREIFNKEQ